MNAGSPPPRPASLEVVTKSLDRVRSAAHPHCVVCGRSGGGGLRTDFVACEDGSVRGTFACPESMQGFPGALHGGAAATLLDGAMTNCLFARGIAAWTGDLRVRYRSPIALGQDAVVRAWVERAFPPLFVARAEIRQGGRVKATATGKFVERPATP